MSTKTSTKRKRDEAKALVGGVAFRPQQTNRKDIPDTPPKGKRIPKPANQPAGGALLYTPKPRNI